MYQDGKQYNNNHSRNSSDQSNNSNSTESALPLTIFCKAIVQLYRYISLCPSFIFSFLASSPLSFLHITLPLKNSQPSYFDHPRNGKDHIPLHEDPGNPRVASISLGEARTFVIQHKKGKHIYYLKLALTHGMFVTFL